MRRECHERFPRHRLKRKPLVSDPDMHHGTCVTHVSWCMSGSLTRGGGENVPGILGACTTLNFTYLARGPSRDCDFDVYLTSCKATREIDTKVTLTCMSIRKILHDSTYIVLVLTLHNWTMHFHPTISCLTHSLNPLRAKFFRRNINIYLHFMS